MQTNEDHSVTLGAADSRDIATFGHGGIVPTPRAIDYESATFRLIEWFSDAAHGWLRVPREYIPAELGNSISRYSYCDSEFVYLEEDCDAPRFMRWYGPELARLARELQGASTADSVYRFPEHVQSRGESPIRRKDRWRANDII